ncbi:MAG TPA: lysylphosphatidylglycerol synthase transmembrane domain-containing protein [Gemmatimonadales bacterium]|nr:lysylphosphatidylglycerol synthase transmembrane domain-containing protein [Gemmatimonadales bacterium]
MPDRRSWWALAAGVVLAGALLWWVIHDVKWPDLAAEIRAASPVLILLAIGLATATFPLRVVRWRLLLRAEDDSVLSFTPLWHAVAIGFMANNILPFRIGELMRVWAASRLTRARFSAALSSVAVERVFDALTVISMLAVGLLLAGLPQGVELFGTPVTRLATASGILVAAALLAAIAVVSFPVAAERLIRRLIPSAPLADRLANLVEGVRHGLGVLRSPARISAVIAWSVVIWLVNALSFWVMLRAFELPVGFAGVLLMQGVLVLGVAAPTTPGYVGVFEAVIKAVLLLFAIAPDRAVAYAVTYHITTFLPIVLLGAWSLAQTSLDFATLRKAPQA